MCARISFRRDTRNNVRVLLTVCYGVATILLSSVALYGQEEAKVLKTIPLSNDTISRQINEMAPDQLLES